MSESEHPEISSDQAERSRALAIAAAQVIQDNKGHNICVLDMRHLTPIFDFFVIGTGGSRRQLHAMSEEIDDKLEKEMGDRRLGREGYDESRWILLDYGNIVVHLFDEETREYFQLEQLWADAKPIDLTGHLRATDE